MPKAGKERISDKFRDLSYRFWHYLFVCRCISCGEAIPFDRMFCKECEVGWQAALLSECGVCGRSLCRCLCPDESLKEGRIRKQIKLYRYEQNDGEAVGNRILYRLKRHDVETAFRFLGGTLAQRIEDLLAVNEDYVVSYIPRTPDRVLEYGFDQSRELAREISRTLSLPFVRVLRRTLRAKTQKKLSTAKARRENAEQSMRINEKRAHLFAGKRVLLVDDVVTSGASMCAAARLLRRHGAKEVIAVSLAVVTHTANGRTEAEKNSRLPYFMR